MRKLKLILFYLISFTWGVIASVAGLLIILFSLPFGRVHRFHGRLYAVWGKGWGGFSSGPFFVIGEDCISCAPHEAGHGLQNCIWGPLMLFIIMIPSAVRYWYLELKYYRKGLYKPYDAVWFEKQATKWGEKYILTDIL